MNFFKPTKLTFAVFGLLVLLLISPIIGELLGSYDLPDFLAGPITVFNLIAIGPLFGIFKNLGINVGHTTDYFGFPVLNFLGWILIVLINASLYYLIASTISYIIKNDRGRGVIFYTFSFIMVVFVSLLLFYSIILTKKEELMTRCSNECLIPATEIYTSCTGECWLSFPFDKAPEGYRSCMDICDTKRDDFVKQCNSQCLLR